MKLIIKMLLCFALVGCNSTKDVSEKVESQKEVEVTVTDNGLKSRRVKEVNKVTTLPDQVQIGIESIIGKDNNVEINVFALNKLPIAGVQIEIVPSDLFKIDSVSGGRCSDADFTLKSNAKGMMLGFSMKGNMIPVASNDNPKDNLLFTAYGTALKNVNDASVALETVLAGKGGAKISTVNVPYLWNN